MEVGFHSNLVLALVHLMTKTVILGVLPCKHITVLLEWYFPSVLFHPHLLFSRNASPSHTSRQRVLRLPRSGCHFSAFAVFLPLIKIATLSILWEIRYRVLLVFPSNARELFVSIKRAISPSTFQFSGKTQKNYHLSCGHSQGSVSTLECLKVLSFLILS